MNQAHYDIDITSQTRRSTFPPIDGAGAVTFQCSQCGECCSSIMIHIEAEKWEVLQGRPWFQERLDTFNAKVTPWNKTHALLPHKPDKTCVFLDEEKRCLIEGHEGKDLKPAECRHFPFASLQLDTGKRVYDCSAACKHVAEDLLGEYKPILPDTLWAKALPAQPAPGKVRLSPFESIAWDTYQARLAVLPTVFQQAPNAETALMQAWKILPEGNAAIPTTRYHWPIKWQQLWLLVFLRKPYNTYSAIQLLQKRKYQDPYVFGTGDLPGLDALNRDMAFDSEAEGLLKAFAFNILNRFVLFSHGHWFSDIFAIACVSVMLARWHACLLASMDGRHDINRRDMAYAIRLTERYYTGHQPRFLASFTTKFLGMHLGYLISTLLTTFLQKER